MVIKQSHLFLHTIYTCHGRGVCLFIILNRPLVCSLLHWVSRSILLIGTELTPPFHFTPYDCYIWQVYQSVALSLILTVVDIILVLRGKSIKVTHTCILVLTKSSLCALSWKYCYATGPALFFSY